jgi:hypothetical protein
MALELVIIRLSESVSDIASLAVRAADKLRVAESVKARASFGARAMT